MKRVKRFICITLCTLLIMLCGCSNAPYSEPDAAVSSPTEIVDPNTPLSDGKTLKLLAITSSFGKNTTQFLYHIAKAEGCTDVVIGRLYGSGCTLQMHVGNAANNAFYYEYTKISTGTWETKESVPLKYGLQDEDWDIIFIQQSAAHAGIGSTYGNYIDQLMDYVQANKTNPKARYIWNMTWAYQADSTQSVFINNFKGDQMGMYNSIVEVTKEKVLPRADFDRIIPSGTVIQNARTSPIGDRLCKDTYHLNNFGGILVAYGLYAVVTGQALTEIHLDAVEACIGNTISGAEPFYTPLTETEKAIIIESVNNALKNPFSVTQSTITRN